MSSIERRLKRLEDIAGPVLNPEEKKRLLREQFAKIGIHFSGDFAAQADPKDGRTPGEKLRDFLKAREQADEQH